MLDEFFHEPVQGSELSSAVIFTHDLHNMKTKNEQLTVLDTNQCNYPDSSLITESVH